MTIDEKVEAYRMYLEGASCDEIGKHFGVSRQCIRQHLPEPKISRIEMSAFLVQNWPVIQAFLLPAFTDF